MRALGLLLLLLLPATAAWAPPAPPDVDTGARPPTLVRIDASNSSRIAIAVRELLAERFDVATLPPRTPLTVWRLDGEIVGFRILVDGEPFTAMRARVSDLGLCAGEGAAEAGGACERFVDDHGVTLQGDTLASPVDAWMVSSRVGERIHPISHRKRFHAGTDYAAPIGTPVVAVRDGVVVKSTRSWSAGRYVVVRHADKSESRYFHLDERFVEEKQVVKKGDLVGVVGKTGRVTGPHLHFELRDSRRCPLDMAVERWPGRARIDAAEARLLRLRLLLLDEQQWAWPDTLEVPRPLRRSAVDVAVVVQELREKRSARRRRR